MSNLKQLSTLLQSGQIKKQIVALQRISELLLNSQPTDGLLSDICDYGISSDNFEVRCEAFNCFRCIYKQKIVKWSEVRQAIISEINEPEEIEPFIGAFRLLYQLPDRELAVFVTTKEGMAALKNCCFSNEVTSVVRKIAVECVSDILIRTWKSLECRINIEGCSSYESSADSKRFVEDFKDFSLEFYRNISLGVLGKVPGLDPNKGTLEDLFSLVDVYSKSIFTVISSYFVRVDALQDWISAVLGMSSTSASTGTMSIFEQYEQVSLIIIVQTALKELLDDPYLLFARWNQYSASDNLFRLITMILALLVHDMKSSSSSLVGLDLAKPAQLFAQSTGPNCL